MQKLVTSFLFFTLSFSQNYSLDFDGESDYVEVTNESAMIANSDQMTLSGWVYPRGPNADSYTQFDGFFGFRNNEDADFYLLQLGNYKVEARLKVPGGGEFTIVTAENSIISETWHHLALTYNGSNIILYIDGIEAGSTGAYGQITNDAVPLNIGRLIWQTTNFDLDGQVDEVSLWNLALTEQQVQDYMYADLTGEEGLVGYWNFNEGSGDTANDVSGNDNDGLIYGATWSTNIPFQGINIADQQIMEDEELMIDLSYIGETMSYDAHSDTSAVSVLIESQTLLLTPLPNWHGTSTITVYMTDENNQLDTTSFLLTVSSVNDPPTIAPVDDISIPEDGTASIFLNVTDIDSDDLIYNFFTGQQPLFNFNLVEDTLFISPFLDWNGQVNLTIFVSDGDNSANTSFDITVTPVNDSPLEFGLISPTIVDTFQISSSTDETIPFTWESSFDVDSDVTYRLTVTLDYLGNIYTQDYENITDSSTAISTNEYAVFMTDLNLSLWNIDYVVEASDEEFTVLSEAGEFILANTSLSIASEIIPEVFALHQNYPNPFNPTTTIEFSLPQSEMVSMKVYDLTGRLIETLLNDFQNMGNHTINWDGTNQSSGMYFVTLITSSGSKTQKIVLILQIDSSW